MNGSPFKTVILLDFEFTVAPGGLPIPLCCVARNWPSGELVRRWLADGDCESAPYPLDSQSLVVAFYASAELSCHLALGWPMPERVLDLYAEFRCLTSGLRVPCGRGLLGVLAYYGLDGLAAVEKEEMRRLAIRGGPYTAEERTALLDYCQTDVDALAALLPAMLPQIDMPRALLRGRYMSAVARMESAGVPIDTDTLMDLRAGWETIKGRLIEEVNRRYDVFVPVDQRALDPESIFGAAVMETAAAWGICPYRLADAATHLWAQERSASKEAFDARKAARRATGLTQDRISEWEDAGGDSASWPDLDLTARELAGRYPALGIGTGYTSEGGEGRTDYPGRLWELLRDRDERAKPRHHPDILRQAAELVSSSSIDDVHFGPMRFSAERWGAYLARAGMAWPRLESGALALDDDTFREMARAYPEQVGPMRELRHTLGQMRLNELTVGPDGRNRCLLSPFGSKTSRNQPSNTKFIFGPSTWLRSLIKPAPGRAVAYCDWSQQELAIAAALSGDELMQEAYRSGDFYLTFAKMAGAVPQTATKKSHSEVREQFKVVSLGVLYGLSADGLARRLAVPPCLGRQLLRMHQDTFRTFWAWSDRVEMEGMLTGRLQSLFGWTVHVGADANPRSLRHFPMQANGAEMMRLACCLATERGIVVCAPVHDALLVEGPAEEIEDVVTQTQTAMREASELALPGFPLRTEAKIVRYPERYIDPRGRAMWDTVCRLLGEWKAKVREWEEVSSAIPV
jgi:hypothetical protein